MYYYKEIQAFEFVSFTELKIANESNFCCDKLEKYVNLVKSWDGKTGKFCIVEKQSFVPIDFCPFCGEKIEYVCVE